LPFLTISGTDTSQETGPLPLVCGVLQSPRQARAFREALESLRKESLAKAVIQPRLVTMSGRPASFLAGGERAVPVPAGVGQVGVQFEEFGTRVNFLPVVRDNGKIHLELEPEISELDNANGASVNGTFVPGRTTNRMHTSVELKPGQSFVISGLKITREAAKPPVAGDPTQDRTGHGDRVLGHEEEDELVLLVTPSCVGSPAFTDQAATTPAAPLRSAPAPRRLLNETAATAETHERMLRLERRLKRLQEEIKDVDREFRALLRTESGTVEMP
jgi:Flp pilus assembly secretin CpaC